MDKNVSNVLAKFVRREAMGFAKYGTTTERQDVNLGEWLTHLQEELMDAVIYLERIKHDLPANSQERQFPPILARRASDLRSSPPVVAPPSKATLPPGYPPVMSPAPSSDGCDVGTTDC
jgi:hypothetical protein